MALSEPGSVDTKISFWRFSARSPLKTVVYASRHNGPFRGFPFWDVARAAAIQTNSK